MTQAMREKIAEMEQVVIAAMTCHGQYQVEDAGEHATEIVKAFLAIPEIKEGLELREKDKSGKLVELAEDQCPRLKRASHYQHGAHHIQRAAYEDAVEDMKEAGLRRVKACELSGYKD